MAVTRAQTGLGSSPRYPLRSRTGPSQRRGPTHSAGQDQKPKEDAAADEENTGRTKRARRGKKEPTRKPDMDIKDDTVAFASDQHNGDNPMFDVQSDPIVLGSEHHEETENAPEDTNLENGSLVLDAAGKGKLVSEERLPDVRGHVEQQSGSKKRKREEEAKDSVAMIQVDTSCLNTVNDMMGYLASGRLDIYHLCTLQLLAEVMNREEFQKGLPSLTKQVLKDLMGDVEPINESGRPGKVFMEFPDEGTDQERDHCWKQWRKLYTGLGKAMDELELSRHPASRDLDTQKIPASLDGLNEADRTALLRTTFPPRAKAYNQGMRMHKEYIREETDWVSGILKGIYDKKQQPYDNRVTENKHADKENRAKEREGESNEGMEMENLRTHIERLQADIKTKDETITRLQEVGQEGEPRAKRLIDQIEAAGKETSKLQSELREAKNEISEAVSGRKQAETRMKAYERFSTEKGEKIRQLENEASNNQTENKMLQMKVDSSKHLSEKLKEEAKKIIRLESQLRIKEGEIAKKNNDIANKNTDHESTERELNEQLEHQKQKIEELKMDLDQAGSETSKMKDKMSDLEHQIRLLRLESKGVDGSSEELLSDLRCQVDELESRANDLKAELRETQEKLSRQSSETSRLEERVIFLTNDLERKDNEIENQKSEIEEKEKTISQHREEENSSKNEIRILKMRLGEKTRDLDKKVDEARRKGDELEEARAELKATKLELEEGDKRNKEKVTQLEERENSYRRIKTTLEQMEKELEKRKAKLEIQESERKKQEDTQKETAKELQKKKTELQEKETELEKKSREIRQKENDIEILQERLRDMESRATIAAGSTAKSEQLEKRLEELTSKSVSLETELTKARNDERTMEEQIREIDSLKNDRDRVKEEMRMKSKEADESKAALERQKEAVINVLADAKIQATQPTGDLPSFLSKIFQTLKEEKKAIEEREESMKKEKECWLQERDDLKSRIHDHGVRKELTVQEFEKEIKETQAENECLRKKLEDLKKDNLDTEERSESRQDDLDGKEFLLNIAWERNKIIQDDHNKKLAQERKDYEAARAEQKEAHEIAFAREKEGHKRELENVQGYSRTLQTSLQESRAQNEREKREYESRVQQLQRELDEACATRDQIQKRLADGGPVDEIITSATTVSRLDGAREDTESHGPKLFGQAQRPDQMTSNHRQTTAQEDDSSAMNVDVGIHLTQSVDQSFDKPNGHLGTNDMGGEMEAKTFTDPHSRPLWDSKRDREINWSNHLAKLNHYPSTQEATVMRPSQVREDLRAGNMPPPPREENMNATARQQGELKPLGKDDKEGANRGKERNEAGRNPSQFLPVAQSTGPEHEILQLEKWNTGTGTAPGGFADEKHKRPLLQTSAAVRKLVDQAASHNYSVHNEQVVRKGETSYPETWTLHKPDNRPLEYGEFGVRSENTSDLNRAIKAIQEDLSKLLDLSQGGHGGSRTIQPSSNDCYAPNREVMDFVSEKAMESHDSIEVKSHSNQSEASSDGATPAVGSPVGRKRTPPQEEESDTVEEVPRKRPRSRTEKNCNQSSGKPRRQPARREARKTTDKYEIKITYKSKTERFSVQSITKRETSTTYKVELYNKSSHIQYNIPLLQLLALGTQDTAATNTLTLREFCQYRRISLHSALAVSKIRPIANKKRSFKVTFGHASPSKDDGLPRKQVLQASALLPWGYSIAEMMGEEFVETFEESRESYIKKGLAKLGLCSLPHR